MSLERIKRYCENIVKAIRILIIFNMIVIAAESICFMWQALMPGKLNGFFNIFRIYIFFTSNIDNNALCLFELASGIFGNLFIFLMLNALRHMFTKLAETISLSSITMELKAVAILLIADSIAMPIIQAVCYSVFVKTPLPSGMFDMMPIAVGAILYFIAVIIQSKAVLKNNQE